MASADDDANSRGSLIFSKLTVMLLLLMVDLGLNCSVDYDSYNNTHSRNFLMGMMFLSVVVEISVFLILFLAMADTYIFRVGLLGLLMKQFRTVFAVSLVYFTFTIAAGSHRFNRLVLQSEDLVQLWKQPTFIALSLVHKCLSVPYYLLNIRAVVKLSRRRYFEKKPWIALVQQNMRLARKQKEGKFAI